METESIKKNMIKGHQDTFERKISLDALITFADTINLITIQSSTNIIFFN